MTRIKVHLASDKQTVSKHRKSHKNILRDHSVLPGNVYIQTLNNKMNGVYGAFEIQNRSGNIILPLSISHKLMIGEMSGSK